MNNQEKFDRLLRKYPHPVQNLLAAPACHPAPLPQPCGTGVTASWLAAKLPASTVITTTPVTAINKAKNVIYILLAGAPSHTDTFDLKVVNGTTPATFHSRPPSTAFCGPPA